MAGNKMCEVTADSKVKELEKSSWSFLKPNGEVPTPRVGHTATYLQKENKVVLIGGATSTSLYNEVWVLDLATLNCERMETVGDFEACYEHSTFLSVDDSVMWVFGGANMVENKNNLWQLHLGDKKWTEVSQDGDLPTPRTYHTNSALVDGKKLLVFGGGAKGPEAVSDEKVYQLDLESKTWSVIPTKGESPKPRQGHAVVAVGNKLFLHGGMSGEYLFDDLNILEEDGTWTHVNNCEEQPAARAAHGAVYHEEHVYIFGGLGDNRTALQDLWRLHTGTLKWQQMETHGTSPSGRLDFTMVVVNLIKEGDETGDQQPFIMLHGGIDETGEIFNDFHMLSL